MTPYYLMVLIVSMIVFMGIFSVITFLMWMEIQDMNTAVQSVGDAISALQTDVANEDTVIDGAVTLIQGIPALIQVAVTAALAAGASPDQLQAFDDLADTINARAQALAAAVASAPSGSVPSGLPAGSTTVPAAGASDAGDTAVSTDGVLPAS